MIVDVAVPYRVNGAFSYEVSEENAPQVLLGSLVQVPFGRRLTHGFVVGFPEKASVEASKLKTVESIILPEPLFDAQMLKFLTWVSDYYCHPLGEVISAAIPKPTWQARLKKRRAKDTREGLKGLQIGSMERPELTADQAVAVDAILSGEPGKPVLLHGVTGSGKTEVYMRVLESVLKEGKGAIVLVPEIALTPQLLGRFSARFPDAVAVLHSDLTVREKADEWERLRTGAARVVVGARSAIFAPVHNLGLIVVDEEHETSFKQEDSLRYHARDVAVVRGKMCQAKIVLGSATPSLESYANAESGRYTLVKLPNRVQARPLPKTIFVDLKLQEEKFSPENPWLSLTLYEHMQETLKRGHQTLLYLNRLGFAHFLYCKDCGETWRCTNCDVALTYYRHPPSLKCHYCGLIKRPPDTCDHCAGSNVETMGFGTEQVEKGLKELFPEARIARLDRSVVKTRAELETILKSISNREADIIIGTQMVAKGHDFPGIALVGILVADASLNLPDYRAHERTFQIITQVSGRAGRAELAGEVVVQSLNPEHPVLIQAANNQSEEFYRNEIAARKDAEFPPATRMAMLRFQHTNKARVEQFAHEVTSVLKRRFEAGTTEMGRTCQLLGPAEAPLSRVKNVYRWHCLVKSPKVQNLQQCLRYVQEWVAMKKSPVQFAVDVDPVNLL